MIVIEYLLNDNDIKYLQDKYINNKIINSKYKYNIKLKIDYKINLNNYILITNKVFNDTNDAYLTFKLRNSIFCTNKQLYIIMFYIILNIIDDELYFRKLNFNRYKNIITIYANSYKAINRISKSILSFIKYLDIVEVVLYGESIK